MVFSRLKQVGVSPKARKTGMRYFGVKALDYDAKRMGTAKWVGEDRKVKEYLLDLPQGASILDVPCGTGRFFWFYRERGFKALGIDISPDMLIKARERAGGNIKVKVGSIFNMEISKVFDVVLCIRFLNLVESEDFRRALVEMQRVAKSRVIFTLRVKQKNPTGHYHSPHKMVLVKESLLPGWKIGRNEPVHEEDYRLIELVK